MLCPVSPHCCLFLNFPALSAHHLTVRLSAQLLHRDEGQFGSPAAATMTWPLGDSNDCNPQDGLESWPSHLSPVAQSAGSVMAVSNSRKSSQKMSSAIVIRSPKEVENYVLWDG